MTNEEAYKWIYVHFAPCGDETKQDEAISIALKAIAKQIPKKLITEGNGYADGSMVYDSFYCPSCDHHMEDYEVKDFCPKCGQKICWEEE